MIELKNISKKFKDNYVLKDINLIFQEGNIYGIYGRNGSGKTVLLKIISGLYVPTTGEVFFDNINYNRKNEFPPNLRIMIDGPSFYPDLTGFENLKLLSEIQKKIKDEDIINSLKEVNLLKEKDKKYSKYSLGMKQKLGFAQAIMENPKIIILDEPFNGIEQQTVDKLINYLIEEAKRGKIIIISTHIKSDLDKLTKNIINIDSGEIINDK